MPNGSRVNDLKDGDVVYARLTDGGNYGDYAMLQIQDLGNPIVTVTDKKQQVMQFQYR